MGHAKRILEEMEARMARGYEAPDRGKKFVCNNHFSNIYIKRFIDRNSHIGKCSYCGKSGQVIDFADLVEHIGTRLTDYLGNIEDQGLYCASSFKDEEDGELNAPGWDECCGLIKPYNEKVYETFEEVAWEFDCIPDNENLFTDIDDCFYVNNWIRKDPVSLEPNEELTYAWQDYSREVLKTISDKGIDHTSHYNSEDLLKLCESKLGEYGFRKAWDVVIDCADLAEKLVKILPVGSIIYRGRPDSHGQTYSQFKDLTSAPIQYAKPNRLSQSGVSVFYGSFDSETPVKEIRNYCTDKETVISIGTFESTIPLEIIDFTDIPQADFWMDGDDWQDYLFLKRFHEEITSAVSDRMNHIEYVPTQVFVEILRRRFPKINGIKYKSSLTSKPNVCLFYDNKTSAGVLKLIAAKIIKV